MKVANTSFKADLRDGQRPYLERYEINADQWVKTRSNTRRKSAEQPENQRNSKSIESGPVDPKSIESDPIDRAIWNLDH